MLEGSGPVDSVLRGLSDLWRGLLASDGVTLLLVGMVIGFVAAVAIGSLAQSRRTGRSARARKSDADSLSGSVGASQRMCA